MSEDTIPIDRVELKLEQYCSSFAMANHEPNLSNIEYDKRIDCVLDSTVYNLKKWFLTRELKKDYTFRHPKDLYHLLLFFVFGKWSWFNDKYIHWAEHTITVKEAYDNIVIPEKRPYVYIDRLKNGYSSEVLNESFNN